MTVPRVRGKGVFGTIVPRAEVYYTRDGSSYVYSKRAAPTLPYPQHVLDLIARLEEEIYSEDAEYELPPGLGTLDTSGDICYDASIPRGGSVGAHSDDEDEWKNVVIYSLGQTRIIRVVHKETKATYNIELADNSILVMIGDTFQEKYTHQVDKLSKTEVVGTRLSLNVRYKAAEFSTKRARV
jgi:alkylated DNA repair dioxygenase AlkB